MKYILFMFFPAHYLKPQALLEEDELEKVHKEMVWYSKVLEGYEYKSITYNSFEGLFFYRRRDGIDHIGELYIEEI